MDEVTSFLAKMFPREEQWAMSAADNVYGMSLPEYHPAGMSIAPSSMPTVEPTEVATPVFSAEDKPNADEVANLIQALLSNTGSGIGSPKKSDDLISAIDAYYNKGRESDSLEDLIKAKKDMFKGAVLKGVAKAADIFNKLTIKDYSSLYSITRQNYQNQMDALDNQVLYIKHQLADRFNKTVQTNIMNMAAKNLRVTSGNVLEMTKDTAQEMTEDMRTAESNAELQKIALRAKKDQAKEATRYAEKQMWVSFADAARKLGTVVASGAGTGESFGDLYKGYKWAKDTEKAIAGGTLNSMY